MIERAVANAKFHDINLHHGPGNLANGDCAFETMLDSINTRTCFHDVFDGTPEYWRTVWLTEAERVAYEKWNGGN